jgi:hypothetical protein
MELYRNRWAATAGPVDHAVAKPFSIKPFLKRFAFLIKLFLKKFAVKPQYFSDFCQHTFRSTLCLNN